MKNVFFALLVHVLFINFTAGQNVGIGITSPLDPLHVNGFIRSSGLRIINDNYIELGNGLLNKQQDNGKIAMNAFGEANTLSIVGGGVAADGSDRKIKLWSNGGTTILGNIGVWTTPGASTLTLASSSGANLLLQNPSANNSGVQTAVNYGGSNYTTASIRAIGVSNNTARLGFFTGYTFQGGVNNLQERITISNSGNVGIGNTSPQQALDINGTIRFSGNSPAAFTLILTGDIMYNNLFQIDSVGSCDYVRINHPFSNNNPDAIILVTPKSGSVPVGVFYRANDGYWYMTSHQRAFIKGYESTSYRDCSDLCSSVRLWPFIDNMIFEKNNASWNILIVTK